MGTKTTLAKVIDIADDKMRYDAVCKRLLSEKYILAWIMKCCMKEFEAYSIQEIVSHYISGTPQISEVSIFPDETNAPRIDGTGLEDATITEGTITYDIRFFAKTPESGEHIRLIINVEAQNDFYPGYPLIKRALYYCSRMISAQYGTEFSNSHYEKIKKVYSIWICMNMEVNSINHVHLTQEQFMGDYNWQGKIDMLNIIFIGLSKELPEKRSGYGLHRLLGALLSNVLSVKEKLGIIENEYNISLGREGREEMEIMCNLGQGVFEDGFAQGEARGIAQGEARGIALGEEKMIINMYKEGFGTEAIAKISKKKIDEVQFIINRKE